MNERALRPANIAAASIVIGGLLIILLPQHVMSIVRLVIATIAAGAGLYALTLNAPPTWWKSPFDFRRAARLGPGSDQIDWIRSTLSGRRQRIAHGPPLPPATLRLLHPLIQAALEREGIDPADHSSLASARGRLSPLTLAVLACKPLARPTWFRTLRPDPGQTIDVVQRVLNDLDRLAGGSYPTSADRY